MFADLTMAEILKLLLPLIILQVILWIVAIRTLIKSEQVKFLPKWGWAILILLGEIFGAIIFLTIGREKEV